MASSDVIVSNTLIIMILVIVIAFVVFYALKYLNFKSSVPISSTSSLTKSNISINSTKINSTLKQVSIKAISIESTVNNSLQAYFSIIPLNQNYIVSPSQNITISFSIVASPVISYYKIKEIVLLSMKVSTPGFSILKQPTYPLYFNTTPKYFNITVSTPNSSFSGALVFAANLYYINSTK
ncbi:MAG: hypothetical protein OH318_00890 [Candidatus Parvarchaeota archaeon]|nr:hypothetical protein [Candidatus Rehaiarchaeum fermentans]